MVAPFPFGLYLTGIGLCTQRKVIQDWNPLLLAIYLTKLNKHN